MIIKKVVDFSDSEIEMLMKAGEIIGNVNKAKEQGEIDLLSDSSLSLLEALETVINKCKNNY